MYDGETVAAVVPAYNEEAFVADSVDAIPDYVDRVYVVDDASTDDTWRVIRDCADRENDPAPADPPVTDGGTVLDRRVVPIQHEENRGVGGAIKTGYQRALDEGVDVTLVVPGDAQTAPEVIEGVLAPVAAGEAGYAKGDRLGDRDGMPPVRQVGNVLLTYLTRIASGYWGMTDPQNGSTAISREALEAVDIEEMYEFYGYCNDLLVRLNVADVEVVDVPIPSIYEDEESDIEFHTYVPKVSSLLLRDFLWRLAHVQRDDDSGGVPALYALGALASTVGVVGLGARLVRGDDGVRGTLAVLGLGVLLLLAGMGRDRARNAHLTPSADE